ncbi:TOBE domain-containing protein, partial [Streptomyces sp. NPDC002491]
GASRWRILRTVILPLVAPGLVAPFLLLFVEAIADLANPLVLGGDYTVLAGRAYLAVTGEYDITGASVYCVMLLVPSPALYFGQRRWMNRKVRTTITGRPSGSVHLIGSWARWPFYGLALLAAAVILSLYGTVIAGSMTRVFGVDDTFTLDYLKEVVAGVGVEAVLDTLRFAATATPVAGIVGLVIAWLVVRRLDRTAWLLGRRLTVAAHPKVTAGATDTYLMVRPETVRLSAVTDGGAGIGAVLRSTFHGPSTDYEVETTGGTITVTEPGVDPREALTEGTNVDVVLDPDRAYLLTQSQGLSFGSRRRRPGVARASAVRSAAPAPSDLKSVGRERVDPRGLLLDLARHPRPIPCPVQGLFGLECLGHVGPRIGGVHQDAQRPVLVLVVAPVRRSHGIAVIIGHLQAEAGLLDEPEDRGLLLLREVCTVLPGDEDHWAVRRHGHLLIAGTS